MAQDTSNILAPARGATYAKNSPAGVDTGLEVNNHGDLLMAEALPPRTELARMGCMWTCSIPTASAFTYVAAWPTTRAEIVLYNPAAAGGVSLVITSAWLYGITSMAAAQPMTLIGQLVPVVATVPADNAAVLARSRNGKRNYNGIAIRAIANTTAGQTTNLWDVLATSLVPAPTTNLGAAVFADLYGGYVVPPQGVFALNAVAGTAAGTAIIGVTWAEVLLTLG